jgi:predicted permease
VGSAHATVNFFDLLGVRPVAGRAFTSEEDRPPFGAPVAVISYGLARTAFGSAEAAVGKGLTVNGRPLTVVGVLPEGFVGASPFSDVDVWFPSSTYYDVNHFSEASMRRRAGRSNGIFYTFIARLAPGATFDVLRAELDVLVPVLADQYPEENEAFTTARARVFPGLGPRELQRERFASLVRNLMLIGGVLLVLGCANVTNVLISRGVRRRQERAVRVALGASRGRLVQLLLTESCLLAATGAAVGVAVAWWLKDLVQSLLVPGAADGVAVPIDGRVLVATLGVSVACGVVAGIAPAWIGSSIGPSNDIGRGGPRASAGGSRVRAGFAVVQLALSLALVTNALLLVGTLRNLAGVDVGFDPDGVSRHSADPSSHGYTADRLTAYSRALLDRLSAEPAVQAVSLSSSHPFGSGFIVDLHDPDVADARLEVYSNMVTADYLEVLRIPLLRGRMFTPAEAMSGAGAAGSPVVLDELLARRLFGAADPLGKAVRVARTLSNPEHDVVVVGVTRNARWGGLTREPDLVMYLPFSYGGSFAASRPVILIKSRLSLREIGAVVQASASAIDPTLPIGAPTSLTDSMARELADRRVLASVLTLLGALGFLLTAIGLYGLLAQMVNERTREFGIRMAIGADRRHVLGLVFRQALVIAVIGGVVGLGLAFIGTRVVEAQLFGLTRLEPWVYLASAGSLAVVVLAATVWPAHAATRIQPVEALRMD